MSILKCIKCEKKFEIDSIVASKVSGWSGIYWGKWKIKPVWPWQTSLVAECVKCHEKTKLLVMHGR